MKNLSLSLFMMLMALVFTSAGVAEELPFIVCNGDNPFSIPLDQIDSSEFDSDLEAAVNTLILGTKECPSHFPAGVTLDDMELTKSGINAFLTFPSHTDLHQVEPAINSAMEAAATTAASIGDEKTSVLFMARKEGENNYLPIGKLFDQGYQPLGKDFEDTSKGMSPVGRGQGQPSGFLSGKSVFLSPGHGWYLSGSSWLTQRGNTNGIVEDFSNAEPVLQYLVPYLWNAGANVYPLREQDMNTNVSIVDNGDAGFSQTGGFFASTWVPNYYGSEYMACQVSTTETDTATFTPSISDDGFYNVYVWYTCGANRAEDAKFTIHHADGQTTVVVNQKRDCTTWTNLGRFYFLASDSTENRKIVLSNQGSDTSSHVIADAVRFGGGVYSSSGKAWWEMSGHYYAPYMGCSGCQINTVRTMPSLAAWLNESWEDGIYLSWHTNAPDPGTGTETFAYSSSGYNGPFDGVSGGLELRAAVHNEMINDIRAAWDSGWTNRGEKTNYFGEINPTINPEMPAALFEVAFHDTPADAEDLKEPMFRQIVSKAVYQGVVRYFATRDGVSPVFLPEPPRNLSVKWLGTTAQVRWIAPLYDNGGIYGHAAGGYKIYPSRTGKGVANGITNSSTTGYLSSSQLPGDNGVNYVRVSATNAGGESFPTETLAFSTGTNTRVLIVNGFDRLDKYANVPESYYGGGTIYRGYLDRMNSYDYVIAHADALHAAGLDFDSASNEAIIAGTIDLDDYPAVVWICGEESTADESLSTTEQTILANYLDGGGRLFISGSEIGWDLVERGSTADQAFYTNYLLAQYQEDTSGTGTVLNVSGGIFSGISSITFDYVSYVIYGANWPDGIAGANGGITSMLYNGTSYGAAVNGASGPFKVVYLGYPFETILDVTTRNQVMDAAMDYLLANMDVEVSYFQAVKEGEKVQIFWGTSYEEDNAGWNLIRVDKESGEEVYLNERLIVPYQYDYQWTDTPDDEQESYCYYLEAVDLEGETLSFGPVCTKSDESQPDTFEDDENIDQPVGDESGVHDDLSGMSCGL